MRYSRLVQTQRPKARTPPWSVSCPTSWRREASVWAQGSRKLEGSHGPASCPAYRGENGTGRCVLYCDGSLEGRFVFPALAGATKLRLLAHPAPLIFWYMEIVSNRPSSLESRMAGRVIALVDPCRLSGWINDFSVAKGGWAVLASLAGAAQLRTVVTSSC
jgi:hypothetical protein